MSDPLRKRLLEPGWRYVPAGKTDVAATIRRIRREQAEQAQAKPANVKPIRAELKGKRNG